ncbi:MAG: sugar nucleotide-binding protein [Saccharospirillaceae bacterium]|nr:NAD(P)-dependent oxidoreductase [Pseudomonadales bacterium]NRB81437.1 sugar nucleotide-binding protein [Saccharospirillaceae bacterium]
MNVIILGAHGQVGRALIQQFTERSIFFQAYDINPELPLIHKLDITDVYALESVITDSDALFVINCASINDMEYVENHAKQANDVNTLACENIAKLCVRTDKVLIQLSTDQVFDGEKESAYTELDQPNPINHIGVTKYKAEQKIMQVGANAIILRTGMIFSEHGNNLLNNVLDLAKDNKTLYFSDGHHFNPTHNEDCARVIIAMLLQLDCQADIALWGIYHYGGSDKTSFLEFSKAIINGSKKYDSIITEQVQASDPELAKLTHSKHANLNCTKLLHNFGIKQLPWRRGLQRTLNAIYES